MALQEPITPQQIVKVAVELTIDTVVFRFGPGDQYAFANCALTDEDGRIVNSVTVALTEEDLAGWGSNDNALLEIVKHKLGYQASN
jgi:hypothetical protein